MRRAIRGQVTGIENRDDAKRLKPWNDGINLAIQQLDIQHGGIGPLVLPQQILELAKAGHASGNRDMHCLELLCHFRGQQHFVFTDYDPQVGG